jgi:hypothetical protein
MGGLTLTAHEYSLRVSAVALEKVPSLAAMSWRLQRSSEAAIVAMPLGA